MNPIKKKGPELVAPAGNIHKLQAAFRFGADAVYLGGKEFNLRTRADNFTLSKLARAVRLAGESGKNIYLALNVFLQEKNLSSFRFYVEKISACGIRHVILSDAGAVRLVNKHFPSLKIHISTQANTSNSEAVKALRDDGASRVILARECSLKEIRLIRKAVPDVELEAFVHGAMCVAYSGRCLLGTYFSGRSANQGDCPQSCRWEYSLVEEKRPGEFFPVEQSGGTTRIMSSCDMNMAAKMTDLVDTGLDALKIEGRMKSIYYTALTSAVYSTALGLARKGKKISSNLLSELDRVSHRPYFTGFYYGLPDENIAKNQPYVRTDIFLGTVGRRIRKSLYALDLKNPFNETQKLEVLIPGNPPSFNSLSSFKLIRRENGTWKSCERLRLQDTPAIQTDMELPQGTVIRSPLSL